MFSGRDMQLGDLDAASRAFVSSVRDLSVQQFKDSLGDWTPRDILAHFIGWNRVTLVGCAELREGTAPFYFYDGTNDFRIVNAGFLERFASVDREVLLADLASTLAALTSYLAGVSDDEWENDAGVVHYRGGPATVARCVDSLIRDYRRHREEILQAPSP